jgi:hypothetical protein
MNLLNSGREGGCERDICFHKCLHCMTVEIFSVRVQLIDRHR